jgi:hypothetical protein
MNQKESFTLKKLSGLKFLLVFVIALCLIFSGFSCGVGGDSPYYNDPANPNPNEPPNSSDPSKPGVPTDDWLSYMNYLRYLANLPPVEADQSFVDGNIKHARYMVKNNYIGHDQDSSNPHYTPEGKAAAQSSNLYLTSSFHLGHVQSLNAWITGPFHGVGMIDPRLRRSGYGSYSESKSGYQSGSGLDIIRGWGSIPASVNYPIMWPAHGKTTHLRQYGGGEHPDPLSGTGFRAPSGSPIYLQLGPGNIRPKVTAHSLKRNGVDVPHAVYDENTYTNSNSSAQSLGRTVLNSRSAIVMMPRDPLVSGATYEVSITANGVNYTWSFNVADSSREMETKSIDTKSYEDFIIK